MLRRTALGCTCGVALALVGFPGGAWADFTVTEGQSFSGKVVDVGTCQLDSATIAWGDGTPTSTGVSDGGTGVKGTHTYTDEGTYNGIVSYTCSQFDGTATASFQATVQDAPLTGVGRNISGTAGRALTAVVAHINDANPGGSASNFTAQIAWGDGFTSAGSVTSAAGGGFDVTGTHTYNTAGNYPVNTSIADVGGSSTTATSMAQIGAAAAQPPRNIEAPVVSGPPHETDTLTTTDGFWSGSPDSFQYQWLRCATPTGDQCSVVAGASASSYTLVHADVGYTMRARVRAHNAVGTSLPADSAPTAAVKPLVLTASFTISPDPTCTGVTVTFDASASKTPNPPIERYRFTEQPYRFDFGGRESPLPAAWVVADGANPRATEIPTYDSEFVADFIINNKIAVPQGTWIANDRMVTLTVRDRAGASASYSVDLAFFPNLSYESLFGGFESRANCPKQLHLRTSRVLNLHDVKFKAAKASVTAKVPCTSSVDCVGTLQLLGRSFRSHSRAASSRSRRRAKPVVLASSTLYVPGHHAATITLTLTRAGRGLVARGKPLTAIARLTTVSPTGRTTTQSFTVTLIGKRKRR